MEKESFFFTFITSLDRVAHSKIHLNKKMELFMFALRFGSAIRCPSLIKAGPFYQRPINRELIALNQKTNLCARLISTHKQFDNSSDFTAKYINVTPLLLIALGVIAASIKSEAIEPKDVKLGDIKDAKGDINQLRMLLKGNNELCYRLFKEALEVGDVISQIQLSQASYGIIWGNDGERDFSLLTSNDLEDFDYYPRNFDLFNFVYRKATGHDPEFIELDKKAFKVFSEAAELGYLPAILELNYRAWHLSSDSYGFAVQLKPFVDKGDKRIDYYFGRALKNGSQYGSERFYEGMYWMEKSCGIPVKFPANDQSFGDFKSYYVRSKDVFNMYFDYDGFRHMGSSVILAPSKEAWDNFKQQFLKDVKIAPAEYYEVTFDEEQLQSLAKDYKIGSVESSSYGDKELGFNTDELSIYKNGQRIGSLILRLDTNRIHQTFKDPEIQPLIDFLEVVLEKSGTVHSAGAWLRHLELGYFTEYVKKAQ